MEVANQEALQRAANQFAENLEKYPIEEQIAVATISKNVLNGCSWEFVRNTAELRRSLEAFQNSKTCQLKEVMYSHQQKISGYLLIMNLNRLVDILSKEALGVFDQKALQDALKHRQEAIMKVAKIMTPDKKGKCYVGRVGIFCTNDTSTITIKGVSYPAFAVTLGEFCDICAQMKYGIKLGNAVRNPVDVKARADQVLKNCIVAPSSNALFLDIAPLG